MKNERWKRPVSFEKLLFAEGEVISWLGRCHVTRFLSSVRGFVRRPPPCYRRIRPSRCCGIKLSAAPPICAFGRSCDYSPHTIIETRQEIENLAMTERASSRESKCIPMITCKLVIEDRILSFHNINYTLHHTT